MNFKQFKVLFQKQLETMCKDNHLYTTKIDDKDKFWEMYLNSFPKGYNEVYKKRREFDCSCCRSFIKHYGNIVQIKDNKLISVWDISNLETPFKEMAEAMSEYVKSFEIENVFLYSQIFGTDANKQLTETKEILMWDHLYYKFPVKFQSKDIGSTLSNFRASKDVFKRSMEELTLDAGESILELIDQNSLYRGEEFKSAIQEFIKSKKAYNKISDNEKDLWCWKNSISSSISRIRNTAIGTLLIDISEGVELDEAVAKFEKVVAPTNYKRPKAIFTKKMIEDAENKLIELGFQNSLERRFAKLEDITVNNILFVNRDVKSKLKNSVFDNLKEEVVVNPKNFNKVEEISINDFIKNVLPTTTSLEVMLENQHKSNLVSLIAPTKDCPSMFKWNNNFTWAYTGDITDSIKQNVKKAGGNVDGVLRFSIQWNTDKYNPNDFDAHCVEPDRNEISFRNCRKPSSSIMTGQLDVDIIHPGENTPAVENITWVDINRMKKGTYRFFVHNFSHRGGTTGFSAEIEFNGQIYSFEYNKELRQGEKIQVADVVLNENKTFEIKKVLDFSTQSSTIWNVPTYQFVKVNVMSYSPNYWDEQDSTGNKHYFFFLKDCVNDSTPRGFFNEFLNEKLTPHRKVFEALGSKMRVIESENQLSGIGFSSTQRNSIVAKIEGTTKRVIKIIF